MRLTFDTNIFVTAIISKDYNKAVNNFINKQNSFIPISLNNEVRSVLLKIHTLLVKISWNYSKNKERFKEYLNEPDLLKIKKDFENIYSFLEKLKDDPEIEDKIELMADITTSVLTEIGKVRVHPSQEDEVGPILQRMNSKFELLEGKINNTKDIKHLILAEAYAEIFADDETYFITDDFSDIINNKEYIENILNYVKVFAFDSSPVSLS